MMLSVLVSIIVMPLIIPDIRMGEGVFTLSILGMIGFFLTNTLEGATRETTSSEIHAAVHHAGDSWPCRGR